MTKATTTENEETIDDIKAELKAPELIEFGEESLWGLIAKLYVGHRCDKAAVDAADAVEAIDAIVAKGIDRARAVGFRMPVGISGRTATLSRCQGRQKRALASRSLHRRANADTSTSAMRHARRPRDGAHSLGNGAVYPVRPVG